MTNNTQINSLTRRITPQNILLVLLLVFLCLVSVWVYCLRQPPLYLASMQFSINGENSQKTDIKTKQEVTALLYSQAVYQDLAKKINQLGNDVNREDFFKSVKLNSFADNIDIQVINSSWAIATLTLNAWFEAFKEKLDNANHEKKTAALDDEINQRNLQIKAALQEFRQSIENNQEKLMPQYEAAGLYAQLVAAIGNRVAYDAQIKALVKTYELKQSPLSLEFVAQNSEVINLSDKKDRLEVEIAHMKVQLGANSPQIKAMEAEARTLTNQLNDKIYLVVDQIYSNAEIARTMEQNLREQVQNNGGDDNANLEKLIANFEQKIQNVWQNYQLISAKDSNDSKIAIIDNISQIKIKRLSIFVIYRDLFISVGVAAFILFYLLVFLFERLFANKTKSQSDRKNMAEKVKVDTKAKPELNNQNKLVLKEAKEVKEVKKTKKPQNSLDEVLQIIQKKQDKAVLLAGQEAAKASARLVLSLKKIHKNILLVDVSAIQIENLIGPHRGLTDVLTADARIIDVIYKDHETAIDILPKGIASTIRAKEFENDLTEIVDILQKDYATIVFVMDILPEFGLKQIVEKCQSLIICSKDAQDQDKWQEVFVEYKKKSLYFLSIFG